MKTTAIERKLAAILSADVVGYSRLMGDDEPATIETLAAYREVFIAHIERHRGHVVDAKGDALLAEFASVVDALAGAVEIQRELAERNTALTDQRRMDFRIGINLGDVVVKDGTIYGDSVNIAARLESLADPGGVAISRMAHESVGSKLPLQYEYLGEQRLKNIAEPVRVYRVLLEWAGERTVSAQPDAAEATGVDPAGTGSAGPGASGRAAPKLSIVVLPFDNLSDDPEQTYFSDGLTEDLITDLSKLTGLSVISRNSAFTYKGRPVKVEQVGRELGVSYVLEGSVRRAGGRLRLTAQLIDVASGHHVWAERYDRQIADIFDVQDEITRNIVTALHVELIEGEQARVWRKSTESPQAYDTYLRGLDLARRTTNAQMNNQAIRLFEQAIAIDPDFAQAYVSLAWRYFEGGASGWVEAESGEGGSATAIELAQKAIALDEANAGAHSVLGACHLLKCEFEQALAEAERAVSLDPDNADATARLGRIQVYTGKIELAVGTILRAMRQAPNYPAWYALALGQAYFAQENYDQAIAALSEMTAKLPDSLRAHVMLAAIYSIQNRNEEAEAEAREVRRIEPNFKLADWAASLPVYRRGEAGNPVVKALQEAGLLT